jgi:hypothetical protein
MAPTPSIRDVLAALEWVRGEMLRRGSPDFIRQREAESRVSRLAQQLLRASFGTEATADVSIVRRAARTLQASRRRRP